MAPIPDILLAEDNPADTYLIREALEKHGVAHTLRIASDGKEALRLLFSQNSGFDPARLGLIILDLNLPRHDGLEVLEQVRSVTTLAHIPVVILTSSDSPRDRQLASDLGATRYLRKPSSLDQFLGLGAIFQDLLEQSAPPAER